MFMSAWTVVVMMQQMIAAHGSGDVWLVAHRMFEYKHLVTM